jgi:hypothetical protein
MCVQLYNLFQEINHDHHPEAVIIQYLSPHQNQASKHPTLITSAHQKHSVATPAPLFILVFDPSSNLHTSLTTEIVPTHCLLVIILYFIAASLLPVHSCYCPQHPQQMSQKPLKTCYRDVSLSSPSPTVHDCVNKQLTLPCDSIGTFTL